MALLIILLFSFLTILNLNRDIEQLEKNISLLKLKNQNLENDLNVTIQINKDNIKLIETLTVQETKNKKAIQDLSILREYERKRYSNIVDRSIKHDDSQNNAPTSLINTINDLTPP